MPPELIRRMLRHVDIYRAGAVKRRVRNLDRPRHRSPQVRVKQRRKRRNKEQFRSHWTWNRPHDKLSISLLLLDELVPVADEGEGVPLVQKDVCP